MPNSDINPNFLFARKPEGGICMPDCTCKPEKPVTPSEEQPCYPFWWVPGNYPPPPPPPYPYDPPANPCVNSTEAKIAKLSKKSASIRKQITNLTTKNKPIIINIGGVSYNFGTYLDAEGEITEYGEKILDILQAELAAIKAQIIELTNDLEVEDDTLGGLL